MRYYRILETLEDDDHPEQEDYQEWIADDCYPEIIIIAEIKTAKKIKDYLHYSKITTLMGITFPYQG